MLVVSFTCPQYSASRSGLTILNLLSETHLQRGIRKIPAGLFDWRGHVWVIVIPEQSPQEVPQNQSSSAGLF